VEKTTLQGALGSGLLTQYCLGNKIKKSEMGRSCGTYEGEIHTGFWWGVLTERYNLEDLSVEGRIILQWIFKRSVGEAWTGLIWFRIGTGGGHL